MQQAKGALASLLLLAILGGLALVARADGGYSVGVCPICAAFGIPIPTPCPAACWRVPCR